MADSGVQLEVEDWVRRTWLPRALGQRFHRDSVRLSPGGEVSFDAVSDDRRVVVSISTSGAHTRTGRLGVGKLMRMRADVLFLLLAEAERRLLCLTEKDMYELCEKEMKAGRMPRAIELLSVDLPSELAQRLKAARQATSAEARPSSG